MNAQENQFIYLSVRSGKIVIMLEFRLRDLLRRVEKVVRIKLTRYGYGGLVYLRIQQSQNNRSCGESSIRQL